jgi:hypothetical protein
MSDDARYWPNMQSQLDMGLELKSTDSKYQEVKYIVPDTMQVTLVYRYDGTLLGYELDYRE